MDPKVVTYLLYLAITAPLVVWVGRALSRHGEVFLIDVFLGDERLAKAVNQLLVIGFFLLNFGYLTFTMSSTKQVDDGQQLMELLSVKVGGVALIVGLVHFANVWLLNTYRRRAMLRAAGEPPVAPNRHTAVSPA